MQQSLQRLSAIGWAVVFAALSVGPLTARAADTAAGAKAGCPPIETGQGASTNRTAGAGCVDGRPLDALSLLLWVMSLPPAGPIGSTGPGGAPVSGGQAPQQGAGNAPLAAVTATAPSAPPPVLVPLQAAAAGQFRADDVLVLLQPGAVAGTAQAIAQSFGLQLVTVTPSRLLRTSLVRLRITDGRPVATVVAALAADPRVRASQPNFLYRPADGTRPRKSALPQYALDLIGADAARASVQSGRRTVVAIIDTGIDATHPDLAGAVRDRFDAVGDGKWEAGAHGTGIAGIIAANGQLLGVAPNAVLLSVRAFAPGPNGAGDEASSLALVRGLEWANEGHADIVNMSLTGPPDPMLDAAVGQIVAAGVIVVAAAGNDGPDASPAYPAAVPGVIAVTATDQSDGLFAGANHGAYIAVAAPGVDILALTPGGGYGLTTGTSQAAAHVSGVLALLRAIEPDLTPAAALALLGQTAKDLGPPGKDTAFGAGRINAAAAVQSLGGRPTAANSAP